MLTDTEIKKARAKSKSYKLTDGNGLILEVTPNGKKRWRYRYRIGGKENLFALGDYFPPSTGETDDQSKERLVARRFTLAEARIERERCRGLVKQGIHPVVEKKNAQLRKRLESDNTFASVARSWMEDVDYGARWSANYRRQVVGRMEGDILPFIGKMPVKEIKPPHILDIVDRVKKRSSVTANLVKTWISGVFSYAACRLLVEDDPTYPLRGRIKLKVKHHPHLEKKEIGPFLRALDGVQADLVTIAACKLLWLTVLRTKNIRMARWQDINLDEAVWQIPATDMKMGQEHIVPLSRQAVQLLRSMQAINGITDLVFPGRSSRQVPMSHEAFRDVFKRAGYGGQFTPHGVRGTFSTYCNNIGIRSEVIELSLAHQERNAVRRAYNHAQLLPERSALMQQWADALDELKAGGKILPV